MMTEKKFATVFSAFWRDLLPGTDRYVRRMNLALQRFALSLDPLAPIEERGITNEMGFRLFCQMVADDQDSWTRLRQDVVEQVASDTVNYIRRFRDSMSEGIRKPSKNAVQEAGQLAERLLGFLRVKPGWDRRICRPSFAGCGIIEECEGDVLLETALYEVKAGDRSFRAADVRQVLTYCALNYAKPKYNIDRIVLVNPRRGFFFEVSLDTMCRELAGANPGAILSDIVDFAAEPVTSV